MLVHLRISNFAIIKHLEMALSPGLNILSGETGAGKSIIINAVNLILGGRASSDLIRTGCEEAEVEALFSLPENQALEKLLADFGISFERELLIKRTFLREGRNRIFVNGSMATVQMLSRLGVMLISISGQHEHQLLLKPDRHLALLDDFAGLSEEREQLAEVYSKRNALADKILRMKEDIRAISERRELAAFQIDEIEKAELRSGEEEELAAERRRLQHAEELMEIVREGCDVLYEGHESMTSSLSQVVRKLDKAAEIDERIAPFIKTLQEIGTNLEDVSFSLRDLHQGIDMDPQRLEQVLERLELLNRIKRKYGGTVADVLEFKSKLASEMDDLEEKEHRLAEVSEQLRDLEKDLKERALALSRKRKHASKRLETAVEGELRLLHMDGTRFQVRFQDPRIEDDPGHNEEVSGIGPEGLDRVEFLIAPNVGEDLRPLARIASGGELSRIMLAVKTILARTASVETLVFDEVDSGISGATAEVVGEKLGSLAAYHQIFCITHLPQIASQGRAHFAVSKDLVNGRTQASVSELDGESRVREIARLLAGREITAQALAHARRMLG